MILESQRIVSLYSLCNVIEMFGMTIDNKACAIAIFFYGIHVVTRNQHCAVGTAIKQFFGAFCLKALVADEYNFVDQVTIKFDCQREREGEPGAHSRRVSLHRLLESSAQLREFLDKFPYIFVSSPVNSRDKTGVIVTC